MSRIDDLRPSDILDVLARDTEFIEASNETLIECVEKTQRHAGKAVILIEVTIEVEKACSGKAAVGVAIKKVTAPHAAGSGEKLPYHAQDKDDRTSRGENIRKGLHKQNPYQPTLIGINGGN